MKVHIRNPERRVEMVGPRTVADLLAELSIHPDTVLVIRDRALVTREQRLEDTDEVEIRPVISGGGPGDSRARPEADGQPQVKRSRAIAPRRKAHR